MSALEGQSDEGGMTAIGFQVEKRVSGGEERRSSYFGCREIEKWGSEIQEIEKVRESTLLSQMFRAAKHFPNTVI